MVLLLSELVDFCAEGVLGGPETKRLRVPSLHQGHYRKVVVAQVGAEDRHRMGGRWGHLIGGSVLDGRATESGVVCNRG